MNKYIIIFIVSIFFLQCKDSKTNLARIKKQEIKRDTAFFYCKNIFEENCIKSNKKETNVYRIITDNKYHSYLVVTNYISKNDKILSKGKLIDITEPNPKNAKYTGKWYYYGDSDSGIRANSHFYF